MTKLIITVTALLLYGGCASHNPSDKQPITDEGKTEAYYQNLIASQNTNAAGLTQFFTAMPKGGDIHHHYSGTIYAETYLDWVAAKGWYININTLKIDTVKTPQTITVDSLKKNGKLYTQLMGLWSDKDYKNHYYSQTSPDQQFFSTFAYFGDISGAFDSIGVQIIKERAISENVTYIETMLSKVGVKADTSYFPKDSVAIFNKRLRAAKTQDDVNAVLKEIELRYKSNTQKFETAINEFVKKVEAIHKGIDTKTFKMRYQTYAARMATPLQVFTDLLTGYMAADNSELIVGVNIVAAENNKTSLEDYTLHMQMFNYLNTLYKDTIPCSLHAGELTLGMVRPKDLLFHINDAISIAGANRIGHGIDIVYEDNSYALLDSLKKKSIPIEINFTSNEFILGVSGNDHPYLIYSASGVPLVISTDDSGVSRNNLSGEYVLLAARYKPSYRKIKEYAYNSIHYSFMSDVDKQTSLSTLTAQFEVFEKMIASRASI